MEKNIVYNLNRVNLDRNTNIDIHQLYEDYSINPKPYCGITISSSPFFN